MFTITATLLMRYLLARRPSDENARNDKPKSPTGN